MNEWSARVGVINIPSSVGRDDWRACFTLMAERAHIFGVNETFLRAAKGLYKGLAKDRNLGHAGLGVGPNPIFWDRDRYRRVEAKRTLLHVRGQSALARRFPGFNDARYVQEVVLRDRRDARRPEIAVLCSHWVPEGRKVIESWRKWARWQSKRGVRRIAKGHLAQGRVVYFIGDTNIKALFSFMIRGYEFRWIRGEGIDKVGVWVPKGTRITGHAVNMFPAPTDHHRGVSTAATFKSAP